MASPEQIEHFFTQSSDYSSRHQDKVQVFINNQRIRELKIIEETNSFCPLPHLDQGSSDPARILKEGYDDAIALKSLMCKNNSMMILPSSTGLNKNFKIRNYLRDLRQIGNESVNSNAIASEFFVIKTPRKLDQFSKANSIHEYFVGAFGTNSLRSEIPNFAFVLGIFECSPPYADSRAYLTDIFTKETIKDRPVLTFCQNTIDCNQVNYLLYENIKGAKTLREFIISGCIFEQYLNVLVQIIFALDHAYRKIDFTHDDLHDENILIRELPEPIFIAFSYEGKTIYIYTKYIAIIIDLGRSHIKYQGEHFGYSEIENGIYPDRSYPMFDVYKILMFTLASAAFGNSPIDSFRFLNDDQIKMANPNVFQNAKQLMTYFVPNLARNGASEYLLRTKKYYYSLPYSESYDIPPIRFLQDAILKLVPEIQFLTYEVPNTNMVYGCSNKGTCGTLRQGVAEGITEEPYQFYEAMMTGSTKDLLALGKERYFDFIAALRKDRDKYLEELEPLMKGWAFVSLTQGASEEVRFKNPYLVVYRKFLDKTVRAIDLITSIATIELMIRKINEAYPDQAKSIGSEGYRYIDIPKIEFDPIRKMSIPLNRALESIKQDLAYLKSVDRGSVLKLNPDAIWLFQKLPVLTAAIA